MQTTFNVFFCFQITRCQVYDDDLKPIGDPDEYLDLTQYDEYDLGHVNIDDFTHRDIDFLGYRMVVETPILPYQPIIEEPLVL